LDHQLWQLGFKENAIELITGKLVSQSADRLKQFNRLMMFGLPKSTDWINLNTVAKMPENQEI
jgi:hypothetical protein